MATCFLVCLALVVTSCASTAAGLRCLSCNKCAPERYENDKVCEEVTATYCVNSTTSKGVISRGCGKDTANYTEGCSEYKTTANVVCQCDTDYCNGPGVSVMSDGTTQLVSIIAGVLFLVALIAVMVFFVCRYWNRCPYYVWRKKREGNTPDTKPVNTKPDKTKEDNTKQDNTKKDNTKEDNTVQAKPQEVTVVVTPLPKPQETVELKVPKQMKSPQILQAVDDNNSVNSVFRYIR